MKESFGYIKMIRQILGDISTECRSRSPKFGYAIFDR